MNRPREHRALTRSDVAALGIAVADGAPNARVTLRRHHDGTWRLLTAWARDGWEDRQREVAISAAVVIVCGANLIGQWTCSFAVGDDVRWVDVRHHRGCVNRATPSRR